MRGTRTAATSFRRATLVVLLALVGGCARPPGAPGAGEEVKAKWDNPRSSDQLDHLRDRAVLIQTDR